MPELNFEACRQVWDTIVALELLRQLAWEIFHNSIQFLSLSYLPN